jgi:hypothetical protein
MEREGNNWEEQPRLEKEQVGRPKAKVPLMCSEREQGV